MNLHEFLIYKKNIISQCFFEVQVTKTSFNDEIFQTLK